MSTTMQVAGERVQGARPVFFRGRLLQDCNSYCKFQWRRLSLHISDKRLLFSQKGAEIGKRILLALGPIFNNMKNNISQHEKELWGGDLRRGAKRRVIECAQTRTRATRRCGSAGCTPQSPGCSR